ncbi:SMC-Scp complex subunit ScpB [Dendrosporobacter sp. 1207_IL3150]|uniref:SMC-Scp complex subunit ScpB n=1 Tax=Dendrosporobacter sp. 1207_IL3150 TaxID=3084054 RepID=UPI002FD8A660
MFDFGVKGHIEALLFACAEPLPAVKLAALLDLPVDKIVIILDEMVSAMKDDSRGLTIVEVAGGYQLCTKPELASIVERLAHSQEPRLSSAALETLAIVAFRQPITRLEIESIRGVKTDKVIANLVERGLIKEVGRKEAIGRPILYGTTEDFLKCLGLNSLEDLPTLPDMNK